MTETMVLVQESGGDRAVRVLHETVQDAAAGMLRTGCDLANVKGLLATVIDVVEPICPQLRALAAAQPAGPVAAALLHLRSAFDHAADGRPESAVSSVVTAAALTRPLALDTDSDDIGLWR